jgi:cbb3-type cytochrome oxidase maturation protein
MTILIVLIPLGLLMLLVGIAAFVWAVSNGQYDDLEGEGARILFDDEGDTQSSARIESAPPVDDGAPR